MVAPSAALIASLPLAFPAAAREAISDGNYGAALDVAVTARDLTAATHVFRLGWFELLRDPPRFPTRPLLEQLSTTQLRTNPLLSMALGILYNADGHRRAKAAFYFGLASIGIRSRTSTASAVERTLIHTTESAALRLLGQQPLSARSARAALAAIDTITDDRGSLIGSLPRVYSQIGMSLYYAGHDEEALSVFSRGYAHAGEEDRESFGSLSMTAGIHALAGNIAETAECVALARRDTWTDEQRSMYPGTFYRLAEALLALERFDVPSATGHLSAMRHDRRTIEHWASIAKVEALTALVSGDPALGLAELEAFATMRGDEGRSAPSRRRLASVRSLLHVALSNYDAAAAVLKHDAPDTPQTRVDNARVALALGRNSDALTEVRAIAGHPQTSRTRAEALSIEAAVAVRLGESQRTAQVLRQLVTLLEHSHQKLAFHLLPTSDVTAIRAAALELTGNTLGNPSTGSLLTDPHRPHLTTRELAVLEALRHTSSASAIAAEFYVSTNTVKTQLRSLYRKLGARNRDEALTAALHHHFLTTKPGE